MFSSRSPVDDVLGPVYVTVNTPVPSATGTADVPAGEMLKAPTAVPVSVTAAVVPPVAAVTETGTLLAPALWGVNCTRIVQVSLRFASGSDQKAPVEVLRQVLVGNTVKSVLFAMFRVSAVVSNRLLLLSPLFSVPHGDRPVRCLPAPTANGRTEVGRTGG
jgi:hypothetical protein